MGTPVVWDSRPEHIVLSDEILGNSNRFYLCSRTKSGFTTFLYCGNNVHAILLMNEWRLFGSVVSDPSEENCDNPAGAKKDRALTLERFQNNAT